MSEGGGRTRATAVITVHKYEPSAYDESAQGPVLTRIHVEESFSGDITGDGVVEFLQAARADGSASFVGIERVTAELGGRRGTFLLQDAGTVQDNIVSGDWFVIPGSGTGQLATRTNESPARTDLGATNFAVGKRMYSLSTWSCPSSSQAQIPGERRPGQGSAEPTRRAPQAALIRPPRAGQSKPRMTALRRTHHRAAD